MNVKSAIYVAAGLVLVALAALILLVFMRTGDPRKPAVNLRALQALPYISHVEEPESRKTKVDVQIFDPDRAHPGVNLYCNHYEQNTGAYLMGMNGRVIHEWTLPGRNEWKFVTIDDEGNTFALTARKHLMTGYSPPERSRLVKLDWNSKVLFQLEGEFHHDIQVMEDGRIVTLRTERTEINYRGKKVPIVDDYLTFISEEGRVIAQYSLFAIVRGRPRVVDILKEAVKTDVDWDLDVLHTNTCQVLERSVAGFCEKGDILICFRNLDLIAVLDAKTREIRWEHDGTVSWEQPHEPTLLDNDNVLIFDNGATRKYSRIVEFDPISQHTVWSYEANPRDGFFTAARGSIQRFPNGNTLITESDTGRVFEVTREGDIVWEWYNPKFSSNRRNRRDKRAIVYRMKRLELAFVDRMMKQAQEAAHGR
jgi:hypothetical protein